MNPNPVLMSIYGDDLQGAAAHPEQEKVAQAELLAEVLTTQGYDIDKLAGDEILDVAETLFGPDNDIAKIAMEGGDDEDEEDGEEDAEAKAKEAEFAGQIMAHSFARELRNMPDEAFGKTASVAGALKGLKRAATGSQFRTGGKQLAKAGKKGNAAKAGRNLASNKNMSDSGRGMAGARASQLERQAAKLQAAGTANRRAGAAKTLGLYGGGTAALGGGAYMAGRKKESAYEELAEKRAAEILLENGIDPHTLEEISPAEKIAAGVEAGAWEILAQHGFSPAE